MPVENQTRLTADKSTERDSSEFDSSRHLFQNDPTNILKPLPEVSGGTGKQNLSEIVDRLNIPLVSEMNQPNGLAVLDGNKLIDPGVLPAIFSTPVASAPSQVGIGYRRSVMEGSEPIIDFFGADNSTFEGISANFNGTPIPVVDAGDPNSNWWMLRPALLLNTTYPVKYTRSIPIEFRFGTGHGNVELKIADRTINFEVIQAYVAKPVAEIFGDNGSPNAYSVIFEPPYYKSGNNAWPISMTTEIATDPDFTNIVISHFDDTPEYTSRFQSLSFNDSAGGLHFDLPSGNYYGRVKYRYRFFFPLQSGEDFRDSEWSDVFSFSLNIPPPPVIDPGINQQ